jgi:hypothetical protein
MPPFFFVRHLGMTTVRRLQLFTFYVSFSGNDIGGIIVR